MSYVSVSRRATYVEKVDPLSPTLYSIRYIVGIDIKQKHSNIY